MARQRNKRRACEESLLLKREREERLLIKIPVLGYFFRKIQGYREPIETALKTEKETEEEVKKKSFFGGLVTLVFGKTFDTLKLRGRNEKSK